MPAEVYTRLLCMSQSRRAFDHHKLRDQMFIFIAPKNKCVYSEILQCRVA